jgi:hypothetical protein
MRALVSRVRALIFRVRWAITLDTRMEEASQDDLLYVWSIYTVVRSLRMIDIYSCAIVQIHDLSLIYP